ncbi:MAG: bacterial Ig-like domain-containing protein [Spirochaetaceae bacterium]|nr:bacterial Ig-like domain-containing protein [Spirochaetaceae bacterium]
MKKNNGFVLVLLAIALAGCASFQSIKVTKPPNRMVYGQGQEFDRTGMEVGGVTKKGEVKPVSDSRIKISGYDKAGSGVQTVTIAYGKTQTTIEVEVVPVRSIGIERAPSLVKQYENITGLTVRVDYGGRVPAASVEAGALTFSGYNKNVAGPQSVTADYYGKTAAFNVTVVEMSRLVINALPAKVTYLTGEELSLEGIKATGTWEGLGDAPVTPKYVSGFNAARRGQQTVVVEANGRQASFTVTVKEPVDPVVWTPAGGFARNITGLVYGGGKFIATGYDDGKPYESIIAYSQDGVTWTKSNVLVDFRITAIFSAGNKFFFTGFTGNGEHVIRSSSDGLKIDSIQYITDFAEGASRCTGIAYGGGIWVAVFNNGRAAYSTDARRWNYILIFMNDTWDGNTGIFFDGANFIALEASGMYRMSKGVRSPAIGSSVNWERSVGTAINGRPITGIVFGNGKWVGIGPNNVVGWSADGTTWTAADNVDYGDGRLRGGDLTGVAYGALRFVAVSNRGGIIYSRDGYNWTRVYSSTFGSTGIRAVAYGGGTFVAVSDNGRIAYSKVVE